MTTPYIAAQAAQADAALALVNFEKRAESGELPAPFAAKERARLVAAVRAADDAATRAFREHAQEETARAAALRAKASVTTDPATRLADVTERAAMMASTVRGEDFLAQARTMLQAGQVARAAFLWDVAKAKGVRDLSGFGSMVENALDGVSEDRKAARAVEDALDRAADEFTTNRASILASSIGMSPDGSAGTGDRSQRAVAHLESKVSDYVSKVAAGEAYVAPVGDSSNTDTENKDLARRTSTKLAEQDTFEQGGEE